VAEEKFHSIRMALKVGVEVGYHKTDEFPQIALQHAQYQVLDIKRAMKLKIRLTCLYDD
jgi:hypothetical protein